MEKIVLYQYRPQRTYYIGAALIGFGLLGWGNWDQVLILSLVGLIIIGLKKYYIIKSDYKNLVGYSVFKLPFFIKSITIFQPDYISIFNVNLKRRNEYGPVAALGTESKNSVFVIRFFKDNRHFTLYKSRNYSEIQAKGMQIAKMLNVELINKVK